MNDNIFRILALLIFLSTAAISIYYRRKADQQGGKVSIRSEQPGIMLLLRLSGLALWGGVFAWLINPAWMAWSRLDLPDALRWLGVLMGVVATLLAYWVFSHLAHNVSPTVIARANAQLVTSGPYRWVRHPLYSMGMVAYLGFALLAENWFIALVSLVGFIGLALRTPQEGSNLIAKFGDEYRDYMRRTGRYFPKLTR